MEQRQFEGGGPVLPARRKAGLETPLAGRFSRENRRLIFAPPLWYDVLVVGCLAWGFGMIVLSILGAVFEANPVYGMFVGFMIAMAGLWGAFSNERITCNLTYKTYSRLEGQGLAKRRIQGSLAELDALVLVAEELPIATRGTRTAMYRLVLHWKGAIHPLLVVEREARSLRPGDPIQASAGAMLQRGQVYAQALGVKFFDNSYYHSPCPVPLA